GLDGGAIAGTGGLEGTQCAGLLEEVDEPLACVLVVLGALGEDAHRRLARDAERVALTVDAPAAAARTRAVDPVLLEHELGSAPLLGLASLAVAVARAEQLGEEPAEPLAGGARDLVDGEDRAALAG